MSDEVRGARTNIVFDKYELNGVTLVQGDWYWIMRGGPDVGVPVPGQWWRDARCFRCCGEYVEVKDLRVVQRIEWPML